MSAPATDGFIEKHASKVQMQPKLQRSIVHRRPGDGPKTGLPRVGNRFGELRMIYRVKSIRLEGQSRLFRNWQLEILLYGKIYIVDPRHANVGKVPRSVAERLGGIEATGCRG